MLLNFGFLWFGCFVLLCPLLGSFGLSVNKIPISSPSYFTVYPSLFVLSVKGNTPCFSNQIVSKVFAPILVHRYSISFSALLHFFILNEGPIERLVVFFLEEGVGGLVEWLVIPFLKEGLVDSFICVVYWFLDNPNTTLSV